MDARPLQKEYIEVIQIETNNTSSRTTSQNLATSELMAGCSWRQVEAGHLENP